MRKLFIIGAMCAMAYAWLPAGAKQVTGFLTGSNTGMSAGIYKMPVETSGEITIIKAYSFALHGGAYGDHSYWLLIGDDKAGNIMEGLWIMDPDTGELRGTRRMKSEFGCTDLTYDYSTGCLLGILCHKSGNQVPHELVKIGTDGSYESIAVLDNKYMAMASDLWGSVYAMGANGSLYRMDAATGRTTLIGSTGLIGSTDQTQSMEVDRDTGDLYWSFLDLDEVAWIARIDTSTGEVLDKHTVRDNALLGALHIPFTEVGTDAPAAPYEVSATASDNAVTLSWMLPSYNINGSEISSDNIRTEVRRDGKLVHTNNSYSPGGSCTWTDAEAPQGADLTYAVTCYDGELRGATAFVRVHTGPDVPAPVTDLTATAADGTAVLNWTAPANDRNGRPLEETPTYRVRRTPASKEWNVSGTTFTDNEIEQAGTYTYSVQALNSLGGGEAVSTPPITAGPAIRMPWNPDFSNPAALGQFAIANANADGFTWQPNNGKFTIQTIFGACDDWLISMPLHLEQGITYRVAYTMETATGTFSSTERFRITLGTDGTPESQTRVIRDENAFKEKAHDFTDEISVEATGDYTLGIQCYSNESWALHLTSLSIEPVGSVDLGVSALSGPTELRQDVPCTYTATVTNHGQDPQTGFTLTLVDEAGRDLASYTSTATLAPDEAVEMQLPWTPGEEPVTALRARVLKDGDVNPANDLSDPLPVRFLSTGQEVVSVGVHDSDPGLFPFNFEDLFSLCETIYSASEIGSDGGMINEIAWEYNNPGDPLTDKHVKVYMANTAKSSVVREFDMPETLTLVYDGTATFLSGTHTLSLKLDSPFPYSGGNLMVTTEKLQDLQTGLRVTFAGQKFENTPRTLIAFNSSGTYRPQQGYVSDIIPCVSLLIDSNGGSSLSGRIRSAGTPVSGATVSLRGKNTQTLTDYFGRYTIGWLPAGDYSLDVDPNYYVYLPGESSVVCEEGVPATLDLELAPRPSASLSGTVTDNEGHPLEGAAVVFDGWESHTATTDGEGHYSFGQLYSHPAAKMSVYATGCKAMYNECEYPAETPATIDLTAVRIHNAVRTATAAIPAEAASPAISWTPADFGYDIATDSGEPAGAYQTSVAGLYQLGKTFTAPVAVSAVSWHSGDLPSLKAVPMEVRLYALTENGLPSDMIYEAKDVPSFSGWNTYYTDYTVTAPYGVMVSIGSNEKLVISVDGSHTPGSYILDALQGSYAPLADNNGDMNLMIRLHAAHFNPLTGYEEPQVTYNLYRLGADATETDPATHTIMVKDFDGDECESTDPDWSQLPDGEYSYGVEPVYADGCTAPRTFTGKVQKKPTSLSGTDADGLRITTSRGLLSVTSAESLMLSVYGTDGVCLRTLDIEPGTTHLSLASGIYTLRAGSVTRKVRVP